MTSKRWLDISLLTGSVAVTRYVFRSHYLYDLDSVNFALGLQRFDPRVHQPHPPGYFMYECLGRMLNAVVHDANLALVLLSILSSCGAVVAIYRMALDWFDERTAKFAGALFLLSPLAWFHGTVALTYIVEAFFSALLGHLCWRVFCGSKGFLLPAAIILGLSAGIRPSSLLFLGPLFLFSQHKEPLKRKFVALAALLLTLISWFLPMILASGGFNAYLRALLFLWQTVPGKTTVFNSSPATSIARAFTIVFIYFLGFGAASIVPLQAMRRTTTNSTPFDPRKKAFTIAWIAPALCFFTFIFLKFVNSGYLLLLSAPACIWLGHWASEWYGNSSWRRSLKFGVIGACAAANVAIFLLSPFYCSYRSVRQFEAEMNSVQTALPQVAPAENTVIVSFDSHFLGFRHAGYYLPGYVTVEYPEVKLRRGVRVFVMHDRDTRLLSALPVASYSRFVLFPLPNGSASYRDYLKTVEQKLPQQDLETIHAGGHDFVIGPISDLHLLFPGVMMFRQGVYPSRHSQTQPVNSRAHSTGQQGL